MESLKMFNSKVVRKRKGINNCWEKKVTNNKMVDLNPIIPINVNDISNPIEMQRLTDCIKKYPNICCL